MRILKKMPMNDPADRACRVCGKVTNLSFEHVPPKGVGNTGRVEMLGIEEWLRREEEGAAVKPTISQKGSGAYSLCRECNTRAGEFYVPEFQKLHGTGLQALSELDLEGLDTQPTAGYVEMNIKGVRPARLAKQIVTMLLAISPGGFAEANPELAEYVRVPEMVGLPERFRLYLALYAGPNVRYNGGSVAMRLKDDGSFATIPLWELAYPPFSYMLTIDESEPPVEAGNITNFTSAGLDDIGEVTMTLEVGFGHTALPVDFRTKATFEVERTKGEAFAAATGIETGQGTL
ncbi:MAG TPA: hypothetical protein VMS60_11775 [Solirubrobacterales bacterium]|nr:hypothetical protein [Solirubrobacterales bacterium]